MIQTDLFIAGGGYNGLALACALKAKLGVDFNVTLIDPRLKASQNDKRAFLLAAGAMAFLKTLEVWEGLEAYAQVVEKMVITDSKLSDPVRPALLSFMGEVKPGQPFGFMVEQGLLNEALLALARKNGVTLLEDRFLDFQESGQHLHISLESGAKYSTPLLIGADGGASRVREKAQIQNIGFDYDASAIVCTLQLERPHEATAYEHFLPHGPFALLPLTHNRASLVWSETKDNALRILNLPKPFFIEELTQRIGHALGEINVLDTPKIFPLSLRIARSFVKNRIALIGDAAHVIHPIAGQGVNLGLKDVASLTEIITYHALLGLDYGLLTYLEPYEMARRSQTVRMALTTDGLNRLFSNSNDLLRLARGFGLSAVDKMNPLKQYFIKEAAGI